MLEIKSEDGMPVIGWLVNWSATGFEITREDLIKQLEQAKIDPKVARATLPKNAAIRAVRENAKGKDRFHRKVADAQEKAQFAIMETGTSDESASEFDVSVDTQTKVTFDKASHDIKVAGRNKSKVEESFKTRLQVYASDQFRSIVLRYIKRFCSGITYLDTGNIYFVPVTKKAELDKLVTLFNAIGAPTKLNIKEEISTKQIRSVMWNLAAKELTDEAAKLKQDFESFDNSESARSLQIRLEKYESLKTKLEMFETCLSGKAEELKGQIGDLTSAVQKKLLG